MINVNFYRFIEKAMKKIKEYLKSPIFWIILALVCYFSGAVLMERPSVEPLKEMGIAEQEEYYYEDSDASQPRCSVPAGSPPSADRRCRVLTRSK